MSRNKQNTTSFMTNINKLVSILEQKDETISKWQAIKPGCDSPYNMKNHVEKLNRELSKWQSLIPEAHTPKLAANKLAKNQSELEAWRNAIPNCETPKKLVKWHEKHQARPKDNNNNGDYYVYINNFTEGNDSLSIEEFRVAKSSMLAYINDSNIPDERLRTVDTNNIINFLIFECENQMSDPDMSFDELLDIKMRFGLENDN